MEVYERNKKSEKIEEFNLARGTGKAIVMKKRYVSVKEVSEYTSLSIKTLYDWACQGKIPSIKYGSRVLFDLQDIDQAMASLKRNTNQGKKTVNKIAGDILWN